MGALLIQVNTYICNELSKHGTIAGQIYLIAASSILREQYSICLIARNYINY
jgi:hypothetical protein